MCIPFTIMRRWFDAIKNVSIVFFCLFRNQVLKHFLSQEKIIESKSGPNSKLTENIETTTVPVGPDTDDRYVERKNIPYCHNQNVGISCQQSPQRTSSQSMRTQTQELKEHANACPTAMKEDIKETLLKEENSYQVRFRYNLRY